MTRQQRRKSERALAKNANRQSGATPWGWRQFKHVVNDVIKYGRYTNSKKNSLRYVD